MIFKAAVQHSSNLPVSVCVMRSANTSHVNQLALAHSILLSHHCTRLVESTSPGRVGSHGPPLGQNGRRVAGVCLEPRGGVYDGRHAGSGDRGREGKLMVAAIVTRASFAAYFDANFRTYDRTTSASLLPKEQASYTAVVGI